MSGILSHILVHALALHIKLILSRLLDCLLLILSRGLYLIVPTLWLMHLPVRPIDLFSFDCPVIDVACLHLSVDGSVIVNHIVFLSSLLVWLRLDTISAIRVDLILNHL